MNVWVIIWQVSENCSCGVGGVFASFEEARQHLPELFDMGEEIEEEDNTHFYNTHIYYTNYATYSIEGHHLDL